MPTSTPIPTSTATPTPTPAPTTTPEIGTGLIQRFTADGTFITCWGVSGNGTGQFSSPVGVVVDGDGNVYVAILANP